MGRELLAQDKVTQFISAPLAQNQWEIEFEQLFKTSLARMQFNLLDIAVGEGKGRPGYHEESEDRWGNGKLCGMYKYKILKEEKGKNLRLINFVTLTTLFGLLIGFTAPWISLNNEPAKQPFLGEKVPIYLLIYRKLSDFRARTRGPGIGRTGSGEAAAVGDRTRGAETRGSGSENGGIGHTGNGKTRDGEVGTRGAGAKGTNVGKEGIGGARCIGSSERSLEREESGGSSELS